MVVQRSLPPSSTVGCGSSAGRCPRQPDAGSVPLSGVNQPVGADHDRHSPAAPPVGKRSSGNGRPNGNYSEAAGRQRTGHMTRACRRNRGRLRWQTEVQSLRTIGSHWKALGARLAGVLGAGVAGPRSK